jgi:mannosyltransferase
MPKHAGKAGRKATASNNVLKVWVIRHRNILLLAGILILALFLRFCELGTESIWLDEAESIRESAMAVPQIAQHTNQPPFYFLVLRIWIDLFGTSEAALRSLSAIVGVLAVAVVFLVGRSLANQRVGLIGAFLASISLYLIYYAQDARAYSLLLLLSLSSYWFFIESLKKDRIWWYAAYFVSTILMLYTHFYGLFIFFSQILVFLVFCKKYPAQRWKLGATIITLIVALVPFVLLLKDKMSSIASQGFWIPKPDFGTLFNTLVSFAGTGSTRYVLFAVFVILAIAGITLTIHNRHRLTTEQTGKPGKNEEERTQFGPAELITILVLWLFVPLLIPFIESQFMTPIYLTRYAIGAAPALIFLTAMGLARITWNWIVYPVLILIVILSAVDLHQYYHEDVKEQWREAVQLLESNAEPTDVIGVYEGYCLSPFDYYYKENLPQTGIHTLEEAQKFVQTANETVSKTPGKVWLILSNNRNQTITQYLVEAFGKDSLEFAQKYLGVIVCRFKIAGSAD